MGITLYAMSGSMLSGFVTLANIAISNGTVIKRSLNAGGEAALIAGVVSAVFYPVVYGINKLIQNSKTSRKIAENLRADQSLQYKIERKMSEVGRKK